MNKILYVINLGKFEIDGFLVIVLSYELVIIRIDGLEIDY